MLLHLLQCRQHTCPVQYQRCCGWETWSCLDRAAAGECAFLTSFQGMPSTAGPTVWVARTGVHFIQHFYMPGTILDNTYSPRKGSPYILFQSLSLKSFDIGPLWSLFFWWGNWSTEINLSKITQLLQGRAGIRIQASWFSPCQTPSRYRSLGPRSASAHWITSLLDFTLSHCPRMGYKNHITGGGQRLGSPNKTQRTQCWLQSVPKELAPDVTRYYRFSTRLPPPSRWRNQHLKGGGLETCNISPLLGLGVGGG